MLATVAVPAPDRELMVEVPGGRLYVRVNGDLGGPRLPLCMVHGGPGGSHYAFVRALPPAAERAIILYDQRGCGRSDGGDDPAGWTLDAFAAEVDAVREALGIPRWHLLGHSWGAVPALAWAATRPAALAGLILSSPLVSTPAWLADMAVLRATLPADVQATLVACESGTPPDDAACAAANTAFEDVFYMRRPRAPEVIAYRDAMPRWFSPEQYGALWGPTEYRCTGMLRDHDGTPLLDRLDGARTLFLTGEHDEARPETVARFAARAGAALHVIPGAAHSTLNDDRDAVLAAVAAFLADVEA